MCRSMAFRFSSLKNLNIYASALYAKPFSAQETFGTQTIKHFQMFAEPNKRRKKKPGEAWQKDDTHTHTQKPE